MLRIVFAIAALGVSAAAAFACEGQTGKVIFEDKFTDDAGGWTFGAGYGLNLKAPGAVLAVRAGEGSARATLNQTFNATEGDFCAEMSMPANAKELNVAVGTLFLAADNDNFWMAQAMDTGKVGLYKLANNKWSTVWELPNAAAIKASPADVISLRAVVKGNTITVIVNGQTIKSVRAQIPSGDFKFGFYGQYGNASAAPVEFAVRSYKVTEAK